MSTSDNWSNWSVRRKRSVGKAIYLAVGMFFVVMVVLATTPGGGIVSTIALPIFLTLGIAFIGLMVIRSNNADVEAIGSRRTVIVGDLLWLAFSIIFNIGAIGILITACAWLIFAVHGWFVGALPWYYMFGFLVSLPVLYIIRPRSAALALIAGMLFLTIGIDSILLVENWADVTSMSIALQWPAAQPLISLIPTMWAVSVLIGGLGCFWHIVHKMIWDCEFNVKVDND